MLLLIKIWWKRNGSGVHFLPLIFIEGLCEPLLQKAIIQWLQLSHSGSSFNGRFLVPLSFWSWTLSQAKQIMTDHGFNLPLFWRLLEILFINCNYVFMAAFSIQGLSWVVYFIGSKDQTKIVSSIVCHAFLSFLCYSSFDTSPPYMNSQGLISTHKCYNWSQK